MKRPQPDVQRIVTGKYISSVGDNRKLRRLWGTEIVDGVEVFNSRRHYHKAAARPYNYETLFRFLGVYDDIKDFDGEGLKSAWFTLNKSKGPEEAEVNTSFVTDNLNSMWWDDNEGVRPANLTLTTSIVIGESFETGEGLSSIDWNLPKEDIIQYVTDNYEALWISNKIQQEGIGVINKGTIYDQELKIETQDEDDLSPDDPWLSVISRYALRDDGIPCTIKSVEVGISGGELQYNPGRVYNTAVVTIEIPYYEFTGIDPLVTRIMADIDVNNFPVTSDMRWRNVLNKVYDTSVFANEHLTQKSARFSTFYETEDDIDATTISRSYIQWEDARLVASVYDNFWIKSGDNYYLKAEVVSDPKKYGTTQNELKAYLFSILDTGYKKKKVPWYKKVVAVIVFIVAVILALPSGGASLTWAYAVAVAFAVTMGALALALLAALFGALGMSDWAGAFASVNKAIAPLTTVASIILVVNMVQTIGTQLAAATADAGVAGILETMADSFIPGIKELASGQISTTGLLSASNKVVQAYTKVQASKLKDIDSRNKDLKSEYEELVKEAEKESDTMMGFMRIYAKPATADWSMYSSKYDLPYERGGGTMAIGNIQRTTKQAIRRADFKEPMFDGMIFV